MPATVSDLLSRGVRVWWNCAECGATGDADLPAIIAAKGPGYDLTDQTAACRTPGCTYWVGFYGQDGQRTWRLSTREGDMAESARRTEWLFRGKRGRA